jgi:hypothetical protein
MPGSPTTLGRAGTRVIASARLAFRSYNSVGTQDENPFAAQWLACAIPCRRFVADLAVRNARLGADVGRYSFIVSDLHRLLPAGLPAHCKQVSVSLPYGGDSHDDQFYDYIRTTGSTAC